MWACMKKSPESFSTVEDSEALALSIRSYAYP